MILLFLSFLSWSSQPVCEDSFSAIEKNLGKSHSAQVWMETTQNDGKPLFIELKEQNKKLYLVYLKSKEGVWAEGQAQLCVHPKAEIHVSIDRSLIQLGKAIPMLIRMSFSRGADFLLVPFGTPEKPQLKISTTGWSGIFIPSTPEAMAKATPK